MAGEPIAPPTAVDQAARLTATGVGFIAVLLWALLALFTVGAGPVPPFQLIALDG